MEATLEDLLQMGFVPPPILTDPQCRARNLGRCKDNWRFYFENAEAAFRHAANRWVKAGRLATTGEYVEGSDDEEEVNFNYESSDDSDDEEWRKKKGRFETQIIFMDTGPYEEYVRWYQANHGYTPMPQEMAGPYELEDIQRQKQWYHYYRTAVNPRVESLDPALREGSAGPEQLYADLNDMYALARWRLTQWDMRMDKGDIVDTRYISQEQTDDGVQYEGKPVTYEYDPEQLALYLKSEEEAKQQRKRDHS